MNLSKLQEMRDRGACLATFHEVTRSQTRFNNWTTTSSLVVFSEVLVQYQASLVAQSVKNPPAMGESRFDPWVGRIPWRRIWQPTAVFLPGESPWTEEPGGLQSTGSHKVRYDWATKHSSVPVLYWPVYTSSQNWGRVYRGLWIKSNAHKKEGMTTPPWS